MEKKPEYYDHNFILNSNSTKSVAMVYETKAIQITQHSNHFGNRDNQKRDGDSAYKDYNYKKRVKERRYKVDKYIVNNFAVDATSFVTLTFSKEYDVISYDEMCTYFKLFLKRIRKKFDGIAYLTVPVPGDASDTNSHRPHFHMFINWDSSVSNEDIAQLWKYGYTSKENIHSEKDFKRYKDYLLKNLDEASDFTIGKKAYFVSEGMNKPIKISLGDEQYVDIFKEILEYSDDPSTAWHSKYKDCEGNTKVDYYNSYWPKKYSELFPKFPPARRLISQ